MTLLKPNLKLGLAVGVREYGIGAHVVCFRDNIINKHVFFQIC